MNAKWSPATKVDWFIANAVWNLFFALMILVAIEYAVGSGAAHEAATIGLVDSAMTEFAQWTTLAICWMAAWTISTTCGWLEVFTSPIFLFGMWLESL